ncbi:hypothetical protein [Leifsonia virtsii]|uniref:Uncharacterized protein n=1 Tax=Leifsonia virtsii TaxID=3035915 RepID=A0ABT8J1T0_9MICO|nr:hypothetical protein [Leifsonia virtsii]MDN4598843.1 hypothetical protein [Leifsonia virtsii]
MATISDGTTTITPALILVNDGQQASRNITHDILGRPDPDVSLAPAGLRTGTIDMLFTDAPSADAARRLLARPAVFTYSGEVPELSMRFVIGDGSIGTNLDRESYVWTVSIPYREVAP